jgi:hypothetical protein
MAPFLPAPENECPQAALDPVSEAYNLPPIAGARQDLVTHPGHHRQRRRRRDGQASDRCAIRRAGHDHHLHVAGDQRRQLGRHVRRGCQWPGLVDWRANYGWPAGRSGQCPHGGDGVHSGECGGRRE